MLDSTKMESNKEIQVNEKKDLRGFEPTDLPMSPIAAKEMMEQYQQLMAAILVPWDQRVFKDGKLVKDSDYQRFSTKVADETGRQIMVMVDRVKKSGFRKLAMAAKISTEVISHTRTDRTDGSFVYRYEVKATTMTGRSMVGVGKADSRAMHTPGREEHDTEATAQTRATNRAISDLIGFGQVSAEEMESEQPLPPKKINAEAKIKDGGHQDRGAVIADTPDGNEVEPTTHWLNILTENGVDVGTIDFLEMTDLGNNRMKIRTLKFLGDPFYKINDIIKGNGGQRVDNEGKFSHWEVPY